MSGRKRKIIKIGPVSLAVIIPTAFAETLNLKKGSEVIVDIIKDGEKAIIIRPVLKAPVALGASE